MSIAESKTWFFLDPDGTPTIIVNLNEFCHVTNLDQRRMYEVSQGKANHHKGWTRNPAYYE